MTGPVGLDGVVAESDRHLFVIPNGIIELQNGHKPV